MAKIDYLNACYTGGGIYFIFGHIEDGKFSRWFFGSTDSDNCDFEQFNACPYESSDEFTFVAEDNSWCDKHRIKNEALKAPSWKLVYTLLMNRKGAKDHLSNYLPSDFKYYLDALEENEKSTYTGQVKEAVDAFISSNPGIIKEYTDQLLTGEDLAYTLTYDLVDYDTVTGTPGKPILTDSAAQDFVLKNLATVNDAIEYFYPDGLCHTSLIFDWGYMDYLSRRFVLLNAVKEVVMERGM